jgi:hypothetical protein
MDKVQTRSNPKCDTPSEPFGVNKIITNVTGYLKPISSEVGAAEISEDIHY